MSTQYSKKFGPAGLGLLIPYTFPQFCLLVLEVNNILSHSKGEVCSLQNCHLSVVLTVDGPAFDCVLLQACAFKKVWPPSAVEDVKILSAIFLFLYGYNCFFFL